MSTLKNRVQQREPYVQINFRAAPAFKQRLVDLAEREEITLTDLLIIACEDALEKYAAPTPKSIRSKQQ